MSLRLPRKTILRRFSRDERGATSIVIGVVAVVLVGAMGMGLDVGRAAREKTRLQSALDSAALAASKLAPTTSDSQVKANASAFIAANYGKATVEFFTRDNGDGQLGMRASTSVPTSLLGVLGLQKMDVAAEAWVAAGLGTVELVMSLDNSGSMAGADIISLRAAAKTLAETVLKIPGGKSKVGLVPFSALVNVGSSYSSASWIDQAGKSPVHSENFDKSVSRLDLYDGMRSVSWGGCVEARPAPYDITDDAPSLATPATLFVPSFAPDEPDLGSFNNDYLSDSGGSCKNTSIFDSSEKRQQRSCKYDNAKPTISLFNGSRYGPNQMCDSAPIQRLSADKAKVLAAIADMEAYGGTNIVEGLAWGWRALSPKAPFADGVSYAEKGYKKVLVLMTDGENQILGANNINLSRYSAYGYASANRLGVKTSDSDKLKEAMDNRLKLLCSNAKATGIDVYTVTFGVSDAATRSMMQACASNISFAFFPSSGTGLGEAFAAIGKSVGDLRLVR